MIAIIIGGNDLLKESGAIEFARETVEDRRIGFTAGAFATDVVVGDDEAVVGDANGVDVDGES